MRIDGRVVAPEGIFRLPWALAQPLLASVRNLIYLTDIVKPLWLQGECTLSSQEEDFQALVRRVVEESGISQAQLARDAGLSYAALHAWIIGARTPRMESLLQLAEGLEGRSSELRKLAGQLRLASERGIVEG